MVDLIRYPAVAGSFYPSDKKELEEILVRFLRKAKKLPLGQKPRILIVPHAGIIYSGQTAAFGFKQLENWRYSRVILLGASHHFFFDYAAVTSSSFWETPLGKVEVDIDFSKRLVDSKKIVFDEKPHLLEHDLEMELIFLQKVLSNFKIVPILISKPKETVVEDLAKKLEENFDNQTILIVSTDLSHYPSAEIARKVDKETIETIISGKKTVFEKKIKEMESRGYPGVETAICGFEAVKLGLRFGEFLGIEKLVEVDYSHSGQVSGDNTSVVGYVSILGLKKSLVSSIKVLNEKEREEALDLARKTVEFCLENKSVFHLRGVK